MPDRYRQYLPLAVSAGLHIIVLIVMMLYYLPLMKREPWYEVSWGEPVIEEQVVTEVAEPAPEQASLPMQATPVQPVVRQAPPSARPGAPLNPPKAEDIGPPRLAESEVVEAPVYTPVEPAIKAPPSLRSNPNVTTALRETVTGIPANNSPGSVESDLEGGKLIRTDTKKRTHSFGDYGEVKLSFSVDMSARLIDSSIRVIQSQNSKYDAEAISVLKDMTFSFRGRPDPEKPYQITIKFSP